MPPVVLRSFGVLPDGRPARAAMLQRPGGLAVEVLEFGARLHRLTAATPRGAVETILGLPTLEDYQDDQAYLGPVVGRCANRIAGAAFEIDGRRYDVVANEGRNCLHGGHPGFDKRLWRFEEPPAADAPRVTLAYTSRDGEEGFPGTVEVRATYELAQDNTLAIQYEATTDRPTPVNLSQHLYFNLSGDPRRAVLDHTLKIAGGAITPVRSNLIPTGELMAVEGTPFDLRSPRRIGDAIAADDPQLAIAKGYDHNWALDGGEGAALELRSPETGLTLTITTDQPGMQVYSGQGLKPPFVPHGAIVFEPQGFPDAVHQPAFPSVVLRPGETYRHRSLYHFSAA